jgi:Family of unknown function (DUF6494)
VNQEVFNASIRKFLKKLGVTAQREIEKAVRQALAEHTLKGQREVPGRGDSDAWRSRSLARDQRGD